MTTSKTGKIRELHNNNDDKKTKEVILYNNEGLREGEYLSFHNNGNIRERSHYMRNELDGIQELYDENGVIELSISYKSGIKHGESVVYNNGKVSRRVRYNNGNINGCTFQ